MTYTYAEIKVAFDGTQRIDTINTFQLLLNSLSEWLAGVEARRRPWDRRYHMVVGSGPNVGKCEIDYEYDKKTRKTLDPIGDDVKAWLRRLIESAVDLPITEPPPFGTDELKRVNNRANALSLCKELKRWAKSKS